MGTFLYILYILLAIVILLFMVLVHELGHYIAGRILKFKITEFSIGFGKAIFSKTNKRGEKISLRVFPLGGYCSFAGEGDEENSPRAGDFNSFAPWKRIIVFLAGVTMNFLTAILFSLILLCTYGGRDIVRVDKIDPSYESAIVLNEGDIIYKVGDQKLDIAFGTTFNNAFSYELAQAKKFADQEDKKITDYTFSAFVRHSNGKSETIDGIKFIERDKLDDEGNPVLNEEGDVIKEYTLGITASFYVHSFWEALGRCWSYAFGLAWIVLKSLWQLLTFQIAINNIGGPISTITAIATASQANFANLLILIPLISANLAVFNLLPFPALDGSHVLFTTIEWIRKKPINRKVENTIHFVGLCILFSFIIIVDILHFVL